MFQDSYSKDYTRPDPTIPGVYVLTLVILVFLYLKLMPMYATLPIILYHYLTNFTIQLTSKVFSQN